MGTGGKRSSLSRHTILCALSLLLLSFNDSAGDPHMTPGRWDDSLHDHEAALLKCRGRSRASSAAASLIQGGAHISGGPLNRQRLLTRPTGARRRVDPEWGRPSESGGAGPAGLASMDLGASVPEPRTGMATSNKFAAGPDINLTSSDTAREARCGWSTKHERI